MGEYILAYDLGTTGLKTALFKDTGELESSVYLEYKTYYKHPKWAEQDPKEWWRAICISTRKVLGEARVDPEKIACISFSGQQMGLVPVTKKGNLSRKTTMIWTDSRADKQAQLIQNKLGWQKFYSITARGEMLSQYPPAKIMWIRENEPSVFQKTYKFLQIKDYIILRLTGEFVTDFSEASDTGLFNIRKRRWSEKILEVTGITEEMLPMLHKSTDVVGQITEKASKEVSLKAGTPVVVGGGDSTCALTGAGLVKERECCVYIGSIMWAGIVTKKPLFDREIRLSSYCHLISGKYNSLLHLISGGIFYRWARDNLCDSEIVAAEKKRVNVYGIMDSKASPVKAGADGLLFLPQLGLYENPESPGTFVGLRLTHRKEHFLRSILEGVAYTAKRLVKLLEDRSGKSLKRIRMTGGGAKSKLWRQIMADVLGKDVMVPSSVQESSALGAAMAGGVGTGIFKDFTEAKDSLETIDVRHPNMKAHKIYNKTYPVTRKIREILEPYVLRSSE